MEINLIPISQLPSRYDIARSALYTRLKDLQIEPIKEGRKAYVNNEQLQLLDDLHQHIQQGGVTSDFLQDRDQKEIFSSPTKESLSLVQDSPGQILSEQPKALISLIEAVINRVLPSSQLSYLHELEEAYQKRWLLSTSELARLLKLSPKTIANYGQEFEDAGFVFTRIGRRKRGEIAWMVGKIEQPESDISLNYSTTSIKEVFSSDYDPD